MFNFGTRNQNIDNNKFYELLDIEKNANEKDIKKAFRKKAMKYHPDKGGDEEMFKKIQKAYETLSNPEKKDIYDKYGEEALDKGPGGPGMSMDDIFSMFGGGGRRGNNHSNREKKGKPIIYNIKVNNMENKIELVNINFDNYNTSNLFDTILANVDHTFLLNHISNVKKLLKPEGNLIISGFKKNMQNNILKLYSEFFDIIEITHENDWSCFRMLKNES